MLEKSTWDVLERDDIQVRVFYYPQRTTRGSQPLCAKITTTDGLEIWFNEAELKMVSDLFVGEAVTPKR